MSSQVSLLGLPRSFSGAENRNLVDARGLTRWSLIIPRTGPSAFPSRSSPPGTHAQSRARARKWTLTTEQIRDLRREGRSWRRACAMLINRHGQIGNAYPPKPAALSRLKWPRPCIDVVSGAGWLSRMERVIARRFPTVFLRRALTGCEEQGNGFGWTSRVKHQERHERHAAIMNREIMFTPVRLCAPAHRAYSRRLFSY